MMKQRLFHIAIVWLVLWSAGTWFAPCAAQQNSAITPDQHPKKVDRRSYALGGGGTNFRKADRTSGLYQSLYRGTHEFWGLWVDGSYASFVNNIPNMSMTPGGSGHSLGFCYEHQSGHFNIQTGVGIQWQDVRSYVADTTIINPDAYDSQGYRYTLRYDFQNRIDQERSLALTVPLLLGGGYRGMYVLAGAKLYLPLTGSMRTTAIGTTTGTYDQYLGHFVEMDNHGLRKEVPIDVRSDENTLIRKNKPQLNASIEFGYEWTFNGLWQMGYAATNKPFVYRCKLAAFAECGMLNLAHSAPSLLVDIPDNEYRWDFPAFSYSHVATTVSSSDHWVSNLFVGVKLTVLMGLKSHGKCVLCHSFGSEGDNL